MRWWNAERVSGQIKSLIGSVLRPVLPWQLKTRTQTFCGWLFFTPLVLVSQFRGASNLQLSSHVISLVAFELVFENS